MRKLDIPDIWLAGFLHMHPTLTVQDAVAWWLDQERLYAEFVAQRDAERQHGASA